MKKPIPHTKEPIIVPWINEWKKEDDRSERLTNFYCPNCFSQHIMLAKHDANEPFNKRAFHCCTCGNYDGCEWLLETLPSDWEIRQQKALRRKALDDEIDDLEDEIDDLERQKQVFIDPIAERDYGCDCEEPCVVCTCKTENVPKKIEADKYLYTGLHMHEGWAQPKLFGSFAAAQKHVDEELATYKDDDMADLAYRSMGETLDNGRKKWIWKNDCDDTIEIWELRT